MPYERIVVVDDEEAMANLLKLELESEGFSVSLAHNGKSGLELIRTTRPDLAILDVMIPEIDGYEVLKLLKNDPSTRNIPVVMLTAKGLEADIQKGLDFGADEYIPKPFHPALLIKRIKLLLKIFT